MFGHGLIVQLPIARPKLLMLFVSIDSTRYCRTKMNKNLKTKKGNKNPKKQLMKPAPRRDALYAFPKDWPDRAKVQMRYQAHATISTLAGGFGYNTYRANDCYDPDLTGVGKQPVTFDQWAAIYNKIAVTGISFRVSFLTAEGTAANRAFHAIVVPSLTSSLASYTFDDWASQKYSIVRSHDTGAGVPTVISGYFSTEQIFGWQPQRALMDPNNEGQFSSGPTSQCFLSAIVQPADYATAINVIVQVDFTYHCVVYSPKTVSLS